MKVPCQVAAQCTHATCDGRTDAAAHGCLQGASPICCQPSSMTSRRAGVPPCARHLSPSCRARGFTAAGRKQRQGLVGRGPPIMAGAAAQETGIACPTKLLAACRAPRRVGHAAAGSLRQVLRLTCVAGIPRAPAQHVQRGGGLLLPPRPPAPCATQHGTSGGAGDGGSAASRGCCPWRHAARRTCRQGRRAPDRRAAAATPRSSSSNGSVPPAASSTPARHECREAGAGQLASAAPLLPAGMFPAPIAEPADCKLRSSPLSPEKLLSRTDSSPLSTRTSRLPAGWARRRGGRSEVRKASRSIRGASRP